MIEKEDIKIGLEFVLPFREDEYEEEVRRDLDRRINGEDCPVLPMYKTDLETLDEFQKTIVTAIRPIFKVAGSPREYFETSSEPRSLGSFVKVACNNIKDKVFYLSTKDIMERGETLIRKKVESKEGVVTMINREDIKEGLKFRMPNNKIERKYQVASFRGATDISLSDVMQHGLVDNKTLKDVLRNEREGKSTRLIPKKCVAFRDITNDMYDTFKAKNHDYGNSFSELFAECGMTYAYGHMAEKLKRVKSLMSDEAKVKGESMKDSLLDLASYAILTIMELDKTKK